MKFTDGYWGIREGFSMQHPMEIRDVQLDDQSIRVYVATTRVQSKGQTLNATLLTLRFSSPMPDVIRVQASRHAGKKDIGPHFELSTQEVSPIIEDNENYLSLKSGNASVRIQKGSAWDVSFFDGENRLTGTGHKGLAHIQGPEGKTYMREQLDIGVQESLYGLGERFTPFVKNGQSVDIWNEDGGTSSEQAYKNIPFYLSNQGYGVFVNHPENVSYELASETVSKSQFSVEGESLDYFIIAGGSPKAALSNYTALTGTPALPPAWSFGLWLSTSFTTDYDEETVTSFIDGMAERDLPLSVFHFDCFWMKEYQWCDFEWDKDVFPDPKGMLTRLKDKGLRICVWINPYIAQKSPLFAEGAENGYLLKRENGDVWQWDMWQAGMGLVDFTNPDAVAWYQDKLKALVDMGVDAFKTDFGERIPTDVVYADGSDPVKMHNYYTQLYNKAVFDVLKETKGVNEAVLFARSATAGGQQFPVHWGGDCSANYPSMAESIRGGLSLGLSGFGFWSHDISGFESTAPPDIYKRWVAFGLLSSHSRLHGSNSYRVPWLFGDEAVDVLRHFTHLKHQLMPYLYSTAHEAASDGLPSMRAMMLEFPEDLNCAPVDLQYMLGEHLLVAPIFNENSVANYYLPAGRWTNYLTGEVVEGGRWVSETHDYFSLPLFVRPNAVLAIGENTEKPDYDYAQNVTYHIFEVEDGAVTEAKVYAPENTLEGTFHLTKNDGVLTLRMDGATKPWTALLRTVNETTSIEGGRVENTENGVRILPNEATGIIRITL
ncbi:alpha-xylosidase [Aureibacillus halotolerans]|uniref:alpha-D-xyloside xylohydrolase n=1 Tax=Aureibacillus halotolerans TaxID=1508390 RepID=A0A4R6TUX8_9BACI|nr:alpha-xylosidase [Aureibacillus halotolerans]TDQ36442.1 alpha-D-xyloside xylohydrolase [Aureibacillus halotolerans]